MSEIAGLGTLNCVYFFLFALGVGYALIVALMGGLSHIEIPGVDVDVPGVDLHPGEPDLHLGLTLDHDISYDVDHPEVGFSPLSPIVIATFITSFGATGLIVNNVTPLHPVLGLLISTISGLVLSGAMFLLYTRVLMTAQGSSELQRGELIGAMGEVIAPIPAGKVGEVAFIARGSRVRSPARSASGQAILRGTIVNVVEESGSVVIVRPREKHAEE